MTGRSEAMTRAIVPARRSSKFTRHGHQSGSEEDPSL
jgi:hypothetical protein